MAQITASQVKSLRDRTGVGMMECKKALAESEGDMKRAVALLREKGAAKAVKRAGRATKEGLIRAKASGDGRKAAMVEVNIETDFAARNEKFVELAETVCDTALACECAGKDALLQAAPAGGGAATVEALVTEVQTVIGENMGITRCVSAAVPEGQAGLIQTYIHPPGKVGVLVRLGCENDEAAGAEATVELAHNLCLQIAFSNPVSIDSSSIPAEVIEAEKDVYRNTALKEGKPEKIIDRIVEGRLRGFFKESCLVEQPYVKEEKQSVAALIAETAKAAGGQIEIAQFERYQLGDSAEEAE